jgi:hypothetical protein
VFVTVYVGLFLIAALSGSPGAWTVWVAASLPSSTVFYLVFFVTSGFAGDAAPVWLYWLPTAVVGAALQAAFLELAIVAIARLAADARSR